MKRFLIAASVAAPIAWAIGAYTQKPTPQAPAQDTGAAMVQVTLPQTLSPAAELGKVAYEATCAACHGDQADGRLGMGPPLIHKVYEPSHHADIAFLRAAELGVRSHHWPFGDMPPQSHLTRAEVKSIITYIRAVQRANGIH